MESLLIGVLTVVPTLLLLWYLYSRDQFSEPRALLLKTFLFGVLLCGPASRLGTYFWPLVQALTLGVGEWSEPWWTALLTAAIPQECAKLFVLYAYVRHKPAFNEPLDGVIYGTAVSFGAALMGNHLHGSGWDVSIVTGLLRLPAHTAYGVLLGAYVGRAHFTAERLQRRKLLALGLGSAIFLHALTDAFLSIPDLGVAFVAIPVLSLVLFWGWKLFTSFRDEQERLFHVLEHRERGLALAPEFEWASAPQRERTWWAWTKLLLGGWGLFCSVGFWLFIYSDVQGQLATMTSGDIIGVTIAVLLVLTPPTWLFLWLFRSGLRGPFVAPAVSGGNSPGVPGA